jgi:tRNA-2-methylthio-N6-dimethylallyladenosine synthase
MDGHIAPEIMDDRLERLQALLNQQQLAFNEASVGQTVKVLLERNGKLPGQKIGKTPWLQSVHVMTDAQIGDMVAVHLVSAGPNSLAGSLADKELNVA